MDGWLTWIIVGAVAGILADWVIKGIKLGLIGKILVGIVGGFLGGWLFGLLGMDFTGTLLGQILTAFAGAVVVLLLLRLIRRK